MISRFCFAVLLVLGSYQSQAQEEVYELRTYELKITRPAQLLHDYFEKALIPALNRQGVSHVGVFEEYGEGLPKKLYLLIPHKNGGAFLQSGLMLEQDEDYLKAAQAYLEAPESSIAFANYTTNLIQSSGGFPKLVKPEEEASLFELRIYASHNEDALRRKVKMFNDHEFPIFKDAGLPMVFFGQNIAGTHMPCLTYLLASANMEANRTGWDKFFEHPEWQRITKMEVFANTVNDIVRVFLKPLPYSQL